VRDHVVLPVIVGIEHADAAVAALAKDGLIVRHGDGTVGALYGLHSHHRDTSRSVVAALMPVVDDVHGVADSALVLGRQRDHSSRCNSVVGQTGFSVKRQRDIAGDLISGVTFVYTHRSIVAAVHHEQV